MFSCQRILVTCLVSLIVVGYGFGQTAPSKTTPAPLPATYTTDKLQLVEEPQFKVIAVDVIPDVENTTQRVIRVNPLDLPAAKDDPIMGSVDSSLFKIQTLLPGNRRYVNSNRMRKPHARTQKRQPAEVAGNTTADSPIKRHLQDTQHKGLKPHKRPQKHKQLQLHFLYEQPGLDGHAVTKGMKVRVAPGAYPVYYVAARTNGRFGKFPIKGFRNQADFAKYLIKSKLEPIDMALRQQS